jgi:hypothetical protein
LRGHIKGRQIMVTTLQMNVRDLLLRHWGTLILTFLTRV